MAEISPPETRPGHEPSRVDARRIAWFSAGLAALIAASALAAFALLGGFRPPRPPIGQLPPPAGAPMLQSAPAGDLQAYRQSKESLLHGYRWIDRKAGLVQIPIERAMQLTAERNAARAASEAPR
ncbi:MAG: hypothetical protein PHX38_01290 [Sulfuricella sp.]|nr:hypothetical protein [Sulfuricella sp.]